MWRISSLYGDKYEYDNTFINVDKVVEEISDSE